MREIHVSSIVDAVKVSELLVPVVEGGVKLAATPAGSPLALSATPPVNPAMRVIVIALPAVAPLFTLTLVGLAEIAKSGVGGGPPPE